MQAAPVVTKEMLSHQIQLFMRDQITLRELRRNARRYFREVRKVNYLTLHPPERGRADAILDALTSRKGVPYAKQELLRLSLKSDS